MTWSETLCQHPADCTAKQTHVSHRHGGEGEERKLCIPEGLCLGSGGFASTRSPGVTHRQYESINQTVYHAEEVTCGEAASLLCLVTSSLTCTVSSAGRSWDHSQWDYHPTHSTEQSRGAGWLGSWEWPTVAVISASKPPTCLTCTSVPTIRFQCWVVLCTGRRDDIALPPEARTSLGGISLMVPMAELGEWHRPPALPTAACAPPQLRVVGTREG